MFLGTVPDQCISQIINSIDFASWPTIHVCCSGTFRFERGIREVVPGATLISNDVSIYSVPIGRYALNGEETPLHFVGKLEPLEELLEGQSYEHRLAALLVASDYSKYASGKQNRFKASHVWHYQRQFGELIQETKAKLEKVLAKVRIDGFYAGDWIKHMRDAIEKGNGIVAFPPYFKGGYEKMFEFLNQNIDWTPPQYDIYDPKQLSSLLDEVRASGVPYCILSDQRLEGHKAHVEFDNGALVPQICYASEANASYRQRRKGGEQFVYRPCEPSTLTEKSTITIVEATSDRMNFLKDVYLKKGIKHVTGVANFLVYVDDQLAGGMIYALSKYGEHDTLYLLSDFAVTGKGRLSKLIPKLALSRTITGELEKRFLWKFRRVLTTAFSHNAVSMKYRGVLELKSRAPAADPALGNALNYAGDIIDDTPEQIYQWWWKKHGRKSLGDAGEG